MNCNKNSELKTNSPLHICESTEVTPLCHAELARVSRGWNAFAKVDKTILQNVELPFNANEQDISASYQRGVDNFNVNTFLKQIYTFITGQILSQAQNDSISNMADLVGWGFHPKIGGVK